MSTGCARALASTVVVTLTAWAVGCARPASMTLRVLDPPPQRTLRCELGRGYYRPDQAGAVTIALTGFTPRGSEAPSTELLLIEMFWRPNPGVTFSDPAGTNAKITYVVDLSGSVMTFQGAGFVRIWENRGRTALSGQLYSSDLHLLSCVGVTKPQMRSVTITGRFEALKNPSQTVRQILLAKKYLRPHDLPKPPAEEPAKPAPQTSRVTNTVRVQS